MHRTVYRRLKELAVAQRMAHYDELMRLAKLDPHDRSGWARLWQILEAIDQCEHRSGRPLLSALAVSQCGGVPGDTFFQRARALGRHPGDGDLRFWQEERNRVYTTWRGKRI